MSNKREREKRREERLQEETKVDAGSAARGCCSSAPARSSW